MVEQANVNLFESPDAFFRRVAKRSYLDNGLVHSLAFKPRGNEAALSLTHQAETLQGDAAIDEYQRRKALPSSGDLPGICKLTFHDLTVVLNPPRPPRRDHDESDPTYGHLHCVMDPPADDIHMEMFAKLATQNGVVRPFVRKRDRK